MSEKFVLQEVKASWEKFFVEIDAAAWLGSETISNVTFSAKDAAGTDVSATLLDAAKNTFTTTLIKPYVRGGTSGTRYYVIMRVSTNGDNHREYVIELLVHDT
ncbi:MAG: hypothetical protein MUC33_01295 [Desulfobacterales bacterium]|jgi:hypothetical protein|nr:hypothetical protein [Desulfobacterales bacterium]MCU0601278.1 hypothetical protein [Desulfobacterales bacterium]